MKHNISISYDGAFPNLCSGNLIMTIDGTVWNFGKYCLSSGGGVSFDEHWREDVTSGKWDVKKWPDNFPENLKAEALKAINVEIPHGCCGGCV